jgi:2-polyprenyl-3-methyl-5-hydroxy-6-metoxy-1,4-benzoquinol methylase
MIKEEKNMTTWKLKSISDAYQETEEFRFNNYVVNPHVEKLIGSVAGKSLLEVGCGFGRYLEIFNKQNPYRLVGCDISNHQIELCKKNIKSNNLKLYTLDFCDINSPEILGLEEYDIVYNVFVILYIDPLNKMQRFIENAFKCLRKGGEFVICTLDIAGASLHPEVFNILKFPAKPLTDNHTYTDGCPIEIEITEDCVVTCYQRNFGTLKQLMEMAGFKNVTRAELSLDSNALKAFTSEELNIIKDSNILCLIKSEK